MVIFNVWSNAKIMQFPSNKRYIIHLMYTIVFYYRSNKWIFAESIICNPMKPIWYILIVIDCILNEKKKSKFQYRITKKRGWILSSRIREAWCSVKRETYHYYNFKCKLNCNVNLSIFFYILLFKIFRTVSIFPSVYHYIHK